jgi:hypothetical protein
MRPEQRLRYAAPADRPAEPHPGGKRLLVWSVANVEYWVIDNPMPRQLLVAPTGAALLPDVQNWAWHEYGMRVGFWRLLDGFSARGIRLRLAINGSVCGNARGSPAATRPNRRTAKVCSGPRRMVSGPGLRHRVRAGTTPPTSRRGRSAGRGHRAQHRHPRWRQPAIPCRTAPASCEPCAGLGGPRSHPGEGGVAVLGRIRMDGARDDRVVFGRGGTVPACLPGRCRAPRGAPDPGIATSGMGVERAISQEAG